MPVRFLNSDLAFYELQTSHTTALDSVYHPLTKYITPNGERQTVTLPLADYAVNLAGNPFDFVHLKDWTIVNMAPADAVFYMSNLMLKGGPIGCVAPTTTAATTATTTGLSTGTVSTATRTATATPNQKSGATQTLTGMSVFAAVLALFV